MKVCKFGGSSLANAEQLNKVMDIVLADPARRIVVVSAPGKRHSGDTKVTDLLIALASTVIKGENSDRQLGAVVERYAEMAQTLNLGDGIIERISDDLKERIAKAPQLSEPEFMDLMKAAGEDNNAKLVAVAFEARGKKARYASPRDTGRAIRSRRLRSAAVQPRTRSRFHSVRDPEISADPDIPAAAERHTGSEKCRRNDIFPSAQSVS